MFSRALLIVALVLASTLARSDGILNPASNQIGFTDGINNSGGIAPVSPTGFLLINTGSVMLISTAPSKFKIQ